MAFGDFVQEVTFGKLSSEGDMIDHLLSSEKGGNRQIHHLTENFRSTQEILNMTSYLRSRIKGQRNLSLTSATDKHGPKPIYLSTETNTVPEMLDAVLDQVEQLESFERSSVALIFKKKEMLDEAPKHLKMKKKSFALMNKDSYLYQLHYVQNLLLYPHLILNKHFDEGAERLIRYNIVPYFDKAQINKLKQISCEEGISLFETISSERYLQQANVSAEQQFQLQHHLKLINRYRPDDRISTLKQDLKTLSDGPITLLKAQPDKLGPVIKVLNEFADKNIWQTLDDIKNYISFLDEHQEHPELILATVEYAKSQEFETVFVLGLAGIRGKRLYVSASRAKQRLFFVGDNVAFGECKELIEAPTDLYETIP
jgi:superfamily I DNA/RNA helicase